MHGYKSPTFNWTKVELKHTSEYSFDKVDLPFNWTKVELKQRTGIYPGGWNDTFNWTKVELKPLSNTLTFIPVLLLIELR